MSSLSAFRTRRRLGRYRPGAARGSLRGEGHGPGRWFADERRACAGQHEAVREAGTRGVADVGIRG